MEKNIAKLLMDSLLVLDEPLNRATELTDQINDEEERKRFRKGIGEIGGRVYTDLMVPIIRQYPDLDPEKN